ncbi:MAG: agmatine deiminase family protein [Planctomycetes bacterium]|nr:agmatine deiminase family protein [Planctomycetota bacterium]
MKRTLLSLAGVGLMLGAMHAAFRSDGTPPAATPSRIVTDAGGRVREVAIHFVPGAAYADPAWRDFLRALDPDVRVTVVCEDEAAEREFRARLAEWGVAAPERFRAVFLGKALTPWCHDRFLATERTLWAPPEPHRGGPERRNEWSTPWVIGGGAIDVRIAPFHFEGGDFAATGRYVFATEVLVSRNPQLPRETLKRLVEEVCGRKLILIEGDVPVHHIGMFLAPVDEETMLVGDARLGAKLLGQEVDEAMARSLDRVAETLERHGFRVRRVPFQTTGEEYAWITYTNVMLSGRTVFLPQFGMETDSAAAETYRSLGFEVKTIDVRGIWRMGGTLRCLLHILRRDA